LTDRLGSLRGRVLKGDGTPSADHDIVIATADPALRGSPRRTRSARPDSRGEYVFENLPPGDYLIAAVVDLAPSALTDAFFLDTLVTHALRVTIAAGEIRQFDIGIR
jgi:hypothetical protein